MNLRTRARIEISRPPGEVFDLVSDPARFSHWLKDVGIIPGVASAELIDGEEVREGSLRRVTMNDGGVLVEEVLVHDRPRRHSYRWDKPKLPFSLLVASARSDWTLTPLGAGTSIVWVYTFELTSALAYPVARVVLTAFQSWMEQNLARLRDVLTGASAARTPA